MEYKILDFCEHGDGRGSLVALEGKSEIPFDIRRVYYIYGTPKDVIRGRHAHRNLEQVIICIHGSCDFMLDDGQENAIVHLDSPAKGLHIKNFIWREFTNFSPDCVVMVLASQPYDSNDYIYNYDEFKGTSVA